MEIRVPYDVMDDYSRWRDPNACVEVLHAGVNYLHEILVAKHARCPLLKKVLALGDLKLKMERESKGDPASANPADVKVFFEQLNLLGTLGYSLWHLRNYSDSKGFRYELKELSGIGAEGNSAGTDLRIRGQGFVLFSAACVARDGFGIEFIARKEGGGKTPDYFALRDTHRFACEATTKSPTVLKSSSVTEFWTQVNAAVLEKREKFRDKAYENGVILIDCTPVFGLIDFSEIPVGGTIVHMPAKEGELPGPGEAPLLRYDDSEFSRGLQELQRLIADTGVRNVILWNRAFSVGDETIKRELRYMVLGALKGRRFWAYFPRAVVFPGPEVQVKW